MSGGRIGEKLAISGSAGTQTKTVGLAQKYSSFNWRHAMPLSALSVQTTIEVYAICALILRQLSWRVPVPAPKVYRLLKMGTAQLVKF